LKPGRPGKFDARARSLIVHGLMKPVPGKMLMGSTKLNEKVPPMRTYRRSSDTTGVTASELLIGKAIGGPVDTTLRSGEITMTWAAAGPAASKMLARAERAITTNGRTTRGLLGLTMEVSLS
jgi:hypothetical protein